MKLFHGDAESILTDIPPNTVQCCVTSPPYFALRNYKMKHQIGLEKSPEEYIRRLVKVFRKVYRILKPGGTLWLNLGDSYNSGSPGGLHGSTLTGGKTQLIHSKKLGRTLIRQDGLKPKDLIGIPWHVAFALQSWGWYLRSDIIWAKPNPMPESVKDRPTRSHEYLFLFSKSESYYYNSEAIKEPGIHAGSNGRSKTPYGQQPSRRTKMEEKERQDKQRGHSRRHAGFNSRWDAMTVQEQCSVMRNKRDVWTIAPQPFRGAHFATFPEKLVEPCILAGTRPGDLVLDPFMGSGTTGVVCQTFDREFMGIDLNPEYVAMARRRIHAASLR